VPWLGLRIGIPRIGEKAAATVRAAVLSGLSKHLLDIAAHYLRKQRQHLWALAACRLDKMPNGQRVLVAAMAVASVLGGFVTTRRAPCCNDRRLRL
jgi:hypothetical protein